jgi:prophage regulatory protein
MTHTILRIPATKAQSGYSRSTIYLRISQGLWTKQISLGPRCIGWPANEVSALNAARISGKSDEEIRALVVKLEAARTSVI